MAAGKGTRLKSKHPKVLHEIGGKPLLRWVIETAAKIVPVQDVYAIIGFEADRVRESMADSGCSFIVQKEQRGTGHAIMAGEDALSKYDHVLVLSGDTPLIRRRSHRAPARFSPRAEVRYDLCSPRNRKILTAMAASFVARRTARPPMKCSR